MFNTDTTLSDEEKFYIIRKITPFFMHVESDRVCDTWTGEVDRDGYGVIRLTFRGKRKRFAAHRLVALYKSDWHFIPSTVHVSHICHNRKCVNFKHFSREPPSVNNQRKVCKQNGVCGGHHGFKNCLLNM